MGNAVLDEMRARARARATSGLSEVAPSRRALDHVFGVPPNAEGYDGDSHGFVPNTGEIKRILALPREDWRARADLDDLVEILTDAYALPGGAMTLRHVQAIMLETLFDVGGCFGLVGVGKGKTLPSFLAPLVVGAKRPLLLVPAKLREKTERDFAELRKHWQEGAPIRIESYEKLGRVSGAEILDTYKPDQITGDEVHALKNPRAARSRRFVRYCREHKPKLLLMSGTLASRSLMDFHHLLALSLGAEAMPLPAPREECKTWARAVDEKVKGRGRPGALRFFLPPKTKPSLANIRGAVGDRLYQTRGVVNTTKETVEASIVIEPFDQKLPSLIDFHLDNLIRNKVAPNGEDALPQDVYRHARTLVSGFFYQWDPPPPKAWAIARSVWKSYALEILEREDERFDSELQVANGVRRGVLDDGGALATWQNIRDTFKPNSVPVWLSDAPLREALKRDTGETLIWVEHRAVGFKLADLTGLPYFGRLGRTEDGRSVEDHASGSAILSIAANSEGRNLQHFAHNLVITPPASGRTWEQLLGRTHRPGQLSDGVGVDVMLGHPSIHGQMLQALKDAKFIAATTGQPQKLLLADFTVDL